MEMDTEDEMSHRASDSLSSSHSRRKKDQDGKNFSKDSNGEAIVKCIKDHIELYDKKHKLFKEAQ